MAGTDRGEAEVGRQRMPAGLRWALVVAVGLLMAGALYLLAVRGEALLADLANFIRSCF
jgi:hypothetical protein